MTAAPEPPFAKDAFLSRWNLLSLSLCAGASLLLLNPLPLVAGLLADAVIVPMVARDERFRRFVRARRAQGAAIEDEEARRERDMLDLMPHAERERHQALVALAAEILRHYRSLDTASAMLVGEIAHKLDVLLAVSLRLRHARSRLTAYFNRTRPDELEARVRALEAEIRRDPPDLAEVKARTQAVLRQRVDRHAHALENRQVLDAQLESVGEVLQLLRDQTLALSPPREISAQLDGLLTAAADTEKGVRDLAELIGGVGEADEELRGRR